MAERGKLVKKDLHMGLNRFIWNLAVNKGEEVPAQTLKAKKVVPLRRSETIERGWRIGEGEKGKKGAESEII